MINSKEIIAKKKEQFYQNILPKIKDKIVDSKTIYNTTNNVFVSFEDSPKFGALFSNFDAKNNYGKSYNKIVENLALSVNPYKYTFNLNSRYALELQQVSLSKKPVELNISLENKLNFDLHLDNITSPIGLKAKVKDLEILDNPKIPWQVDHVLEDNLKATEGLRVLDEYGFDNYYLTNIFSAGNLGQDKKLVSTRQSITAIDDILGKNYLKNIREYDLFNDFVVFENSFLYNKFYIVFIPGKFEYEAFELWPKDSLWNYDNYDYNYEFEPFEGRTTYAKLQTGGYYAARLGVLEYLNKIKKQCRVLVIRIIENDYSIPVGVWQVRENVRNAFVNRKVFNSKHDLYNYLENNLKRKSKILKESRLFKQSRLNEFW